MAIFVVQCDVQHIATFTRFCAMCDVQSGLFPGPSRSKKYSVSRLLIITTIVTAHTHELY